MIEGENITPLIESFQDMMIPEKIIKILKKNFRGQKNLLSNNELVLNLK